MGNYVSDPELRLLQRRRGAHFGPDERLHHELQNSPLFTHDVLTRLPNLFEQRGLLGSVLRQNREGFAAMPTDERIYINTSAPSSAVVCGVQGSGKSHTVSCLLECGLIPDKHIGNLPEPLTGIVFHFDEENGDRPCEAAFLSMPHPKHPVASNCKVTVLVSPSNLKTRRKVYAELPNVDVQPLYLSESNLNSRRMLSMMGCDDIERMPLYIHTALSILRRMGEDFDYKTFKQRLEDADFNPAQRSMLNMRTDLLDSYLNEQAPSLISWFSQGKLVVVDLSDPFLDGTSASIIFDIVLGLFVEWRPHSGPNRKIIVLDEAHKYLTNSDSARLTRSVSSLIRQQRHLGIRIIISTQEPTVVPATILDLTSFIICHKFSSPSWCSHLKRHVSLLDGGNSNTQQEPWFQEVMQLHTGEALLFSSNALGVSEEILHGSDIPVACVGVGYLKIQIRPRITFDGGTSVMAVKGQEAEHSALFPELRSASVATAFPPKKMPSAPSSTESLLPVKGTEHIRAAEGLGLLEVQPGKISLGRALIKLKDNPMKVKEQPSVPSNNASLLNDSTRSYSPDTVAASSSGAFCDLIKVLEQFKSEGITRPKRKLVCERLLTLYPSAFQKAGVTKWKKFLAAAVKQGYVKVGGGADGTGIWVSLP